MVNAFNTLEDMYRCMLIAIVHTHM